MPQPSNYALSLFLALAACGSAENQQPREVKKIEVTDGSSSLQRLRALSEQNRNLALRRAIQDAGQVCRRIKSSKEVGKHENLTMFTARCDEDKNWAIFIAPTSDVQVRSCGHVAQLGLPTCETGKPAASPKSQ